MAPTPSAQTSRLQSFDPATGEVVGEVPITPVEEIPAVVARAREAHAGWAALGLQGRLEALRPAGPKLVERTEELGLLLTREMGKPLREGKGEVKGCGGSLEKTLHSIAEALEPTPLEDDNTRSTIFYDPLGVCASISPWNFPLAMPHWMVVPALMAGNTVVLKPSEETPLIAQAYADVLGEGLPAGVLQVIHGADEQGKALVRADVDLIAFTGSRAAGKHILESASHGLKRVVLELGGKDPLVVLRDADLEKAATFATNNSFRNAGQVCVSTERIYVAEEIAAKFEAKMRELTAGLRVGPGTEDGIDIGPMINATQRTHVLAQIEDAVSRGARLVAGGEGHRDNFVMPTIIADVSPDMEVLREESFGPVTCIVPFSSDEEAVRLANDTPYGLGAAVFGEEDHAYSVARRIQAGMVGVNKSCGGASGSPWVGAKESGYGFHGSPAGHRQFTQTRVVSVPK